jgi:hypothetical protein
MKQSLILFLLSFTNIALYGQTSQEWMACRDSIYAFVKKSAEVSAFDHSIATSLFELYLDAKQHNKVQEVKKELDNHPDIVKARQMSDSMMIALETIYNNLPAIYVLKTETCDLVNILRVSVNRFHNAVYILYFTELYAKEVDTIYADVQKHIDELLKRYTSFLSE